MGHEYNVIAGATIQPATFVKVSTAADNTVLVAGSGDKPFGIAQHWAHSAPLPSATGEAANVGDGLRVFQQDEICLVQAGTAGFSHGDYLKPNTNSDGTAVTAGGTDYFGAVAFQSTAGGDFGLVKVQLGKL